MGMEPSQTRLDYLLSQYQTRQASEEERQELAVLLEHDWNELAPGLRADHIDWEQMLASIKQHDQREPPVRRLPLLYSGWFRVAAVVLLVLGLGIGAYIRTQHRHKSLEARIQPAHPVEITPGTTKAVLTLSGGRQVILDSTTRDTVLTEGADVIASKKGRLAYNTGSASKGAEAVYNTLTTPRGGQYQLTLPDGTKVWLNAASSITYPTAFNGKDRTVIVTGETYFEVARKANQPFIVKSGEMKVAVLGTSFNINAYTDESTIKTSLLEGSIKVSKGYMAATLAPGQQAQMDAGDGIEVARMSNPAAVIAWKNGYFAFDKTDLSTVMRQLSRWYDFDVSYEGGKAPTDNFWGDLKRNARLSDIFAVLAKSGISFTINGNKVVVLNKHEISSR